MRIPAFTAYSEPDPSSPANDESGISGWTRASDAIVWYGEIRTAGRLQPSVTLRLPEGETSHLGLKIRPVAGNDARLVAGPRKAPPSGGKAIRAATVRGTGRDTVVPFGSIDHLVPGYTRFALEGIDKSGAEFGRPIDLTLSGPAASGADFNMKPRRNAASVHLFYPTPPDTRIEEFTNDLVVRTDPLWSFYMACGFHRGYFGIQVNSPTERRIIFSVWDSGNEPVDRDRVAEEDRVTLLGRGDGVVASGFGNEGTGSHSHKVYAWKKGTTYRFRLTARPDGTATIYSGFFYFPETRRWDLIASFRAPKDGGFLRGLHSFNENFAGENGQRLRLAVFGPARARTVDGERLELVTARFSHDPTGREDRSDYAAWVIKGRFALANGGYVSRPIRFGDEIRRSTEPVSSPVEFPTGRKAPRT